MDMSVFSALNTSLAAIKEIGSALVSLRDETKLSAIRADLMAQIVTAREAMFSIQNEREELKAALADAKNEIAEIKQRALELDQYEEFEVTAGVWAYRAKDGGRSTVKPHPYCPNCFQDKKLSVLQRSTRGFQGFLNCHRCDLEIADGTFEQPGF